MNELNGGHGSDTPPPQPPSSCGTCYWWMRDTVIWDDYGRCTNVVSKFRGDSTHQNGWCKGYRPRG
jgi:hypothetical protein